MKVNLLRELDTLHFILFNNQLKKISNFFINCPIDALFFFLQQFDSYKLYPEIRVYKQKTEKKWSTEKFAFRAPL